MTQTPGRRAPGVARPGRGAAFGGRGGCVVRGLRRRRGMMRATRRAGGAAPSPKQRGEGWSPARCSDEAGAGAQRGATCAGTAARTRATGLARPSRAAAQGVTSPASASPLRLRTRCCGTWPSPRGTRPASASWLAPLFRARRIRGPIWPVFASLKTSVEIEALDDLLWKSIAKTPMGIKVKAK